MNLSGAFNDVCASSYLKELEAHLYLLGFDDNIVDEAVKYCTKNYESLCSAVRGDASPDALKTEKRFNPKKALMLHLFKIPGLMSSHNLSGISSDITVDTLLDIHVYTAMYLKKHRTVGIDLSAYKWLSLIFNDKIFKVGSLQYELSHMAPFEWRGIEYDLDAFDKVPLNTPVINLHVQRGSDISPIAVDESLDRAHDFIARHFRDYLSDFYVCNSWLLYDGNKKMLDRNSHIVRFAERFDIIGKSDDPSMAIFHIFGKRYKKISDYPQITSLQRNALRNFRSLGVGCGFFKKNAPLS